MEEHLFCSFQYEVKLSHKTIAFLFGFQVAFFFFFFSWATFHVWISCFATSQEAAKKEASESLWKEVL